MRSALESITHINPQNRRFQAVTCIAAAIAIAIGVFMVAAWHSHNAWLADTFPNIFYMKYNTSLAFIAGGAGLLAAQFGNKFFTLTAAGIVLAIGGLTLTQYLTGVNLYIDEFLLLDYLHPDNPLRGRMAPSAALALTCFGATLVLLATEAKRGLPHVMTMEALGFVVLAVGATAAAGYLTHSGFAYSWGTTARVAPQAAMGFMALGVGLVVLTWQYQSMRVARVPLWLPAILCFLVLLLDLSTPRGFAGAIAYIPIIFCSLWFTRPSTAFIFAAIATALAVLGHLDKAPGDVVPWLAIASRAMSVGALWFVATLVYINRRGDARFKQSNSRLQAVVDHALDGLIAINEQGIVEHFNPACERIFGYRSDEVVGHNIKMLMPEPYHGEHDGYLSRYLKTGEARIIGTAGREVTARRKDGSEFPMDLSISAFQLEDGRHFSGIVRDITERKAAERQIKEEAARMLAVMNTVLDGVVTIDEHGTIQTFNPSAARIFGYQPDEVIGKNVNMLMPEPYHGGHDGYLKSYLATGQAKVIGIGRELSGRRKDGSVFPMELGINEMQVQGTRMFVGTVRDISGRKAAETKLRRYTSDLERSNQELDDFAYIASHDLKEPLRGLFNHAQFLLEDYKTKFDAEGQRRLDRLGKLCQRMEQLINDLMYFSRLGRAELAIKDTDVNAVIADVQKTMDVFIDERHAEIVVPQPLPTILCDPVRTTEVFRNLITNAVKYCDKDNPLVEIGFVDLLDTAAGVERDVFYVKDNGIGIEPEFHQEIFRIFRRLNAPSGAEQAGTGVGLTFVKKIVERQGGRIWLQSEAEKGSTFYFTLSSHSGPAMAA
jgi:PAS domain S-box-containing protein